MEEERIKTVKKSGGAFQTMGLSPFVYKAIVRMGYKLPTPIQRKVIPIALDGRDIVAMARTGSGKTTAFMVPVVESLKTHSLTVGCRALVLSPTRELALQIFQYARKLCKFTDLRVTLLAGGTSLESQFESLASNPDIVIATPGRLAHHIQEVKAFSLKCLSMLVFDEADRLFEMGFAEQIRDIMVSTPTNKQVLLISATMPSQLADFAKAGLNNPAVIRLDVEHTLSEDLSVLFCLTRSDEKVAALIKIIRDMENITTEKDKENKLAKKNKRNFIVFASSRHHVEYLGEILRQLNISVSLVYGSMDQTARNNALNDFRTQKVSVMIVTDVAARGIDLPVLDCVINYDFPTSSKLFVHRVGRTARAGRDGIAISLFTNSDLPYVIDLLTFLGKKIEPYNEEDLYEENNKSVLKKAQDFLLPLRMLGDAIKMGYVLPENADVEGIRNLMKKDPSLQSLEKSMHSAHGLYLKTRNSASANGVRRAKEMILEYGGIEKLYLMNHPVFFAKKNLDMEMKAVDMITSLRNFRPTKQQQAHKFQTLPMLSLLAEKKKAAENLNTVAKKIIEQSHSKKDRHYHLWHNEDAEGEVEAYGNSSASEISDEDMEEETAEVITSSALTRKFSGKSASQKEKAATKGVRCLEDIVKELKEKKSMNSEGQEDIFNASRFRSKEYVDISMAEGTQMKDFGLSLDSAKFDVAPDENRDMKKSQQVRKWDAKKKKYVMISVDANGRVIEDKKKQKNEAGQVIKKSAKKVGDLYKKWENSTKKRIQHMGELEDPSASMKKRGRRVETGGYEDDGEDGERPTRSGKASLVEKMKQHPLYKTANYAGVVESFENKWDMTHKMKRKFEKLKDAVEGKVTRGDSSRRNKSDQIVTSATQIQAHRKKAEDREIKQNPTLRKKKSMDSRKRHMDKVQRKMDQGGARKRSFNVGAGSNKNGKNVKKSSFKKRR